MLVVSVVVTSRSNLAAESRIFQQAQDLVCEGLRLFGQKQVATRYCLER
jgi:hypothetical protein